MPGTGKDRKSGDRIAVHTKMCATLIGESPSVKWFSARRRANNIKII